MAGINTMFVQPLTAIRSTTEQHDVVGTLRREGNKWYKCVALKTAPTADVDCVVGDALCYTDYSAHEVGSDVTDQDATLPAGIALGTIDMSADKGKIVWIQVKGPATVAITVANSAAAGQLFDLGSTGVADKTFTLWVSTNEYTPAGTLINATTKEVLLDCPF